MTVYKKGSTSREDETKSSTISCSIVLKTKILKTALINNSIPRSLLSKDNRINIGDVHAWEDKELGVTKYSRNTAHKPHNQKKLHNLLDTVHEINKHLLSTPDKPNSKPKPKRTYKTRSELQDSIKELKNDNEILNNVVVEIFRAYEQLNEFIVTNQFDNYVYQNIIRQHSIALGKDKLQVIK